MHFPLTIQLRAKKFYIILASIQPPQSRFSGYNDDLVGADFTKLAFSMFNISLLVRNHVHI
jgi:hypothetical protein